MTESKSSRDHSNIESYKTDFYAHTSTKYSSCNIQQGNIAEQIKGKIILR